MGNTREVEVWEFKCISQSRDFYSDLDFSLRPKPFLPPLTSYPQQTSCFRNIQ